MKKIIMIVFMASIISILSGCQKETQIEVTCNGKQIQYITEKKDDFSDLMESRMIFNHGDKVEINIKKDNVKIIEYVLNEDGTYQYTKGTDVELLDNDNVSFEISFNMFDLLSSQKLEAPDPSIRGCLVEYDENILMFVYETNVGDIEETMKK